jgi:hypothetical protein
MAKLNTYVHVHDEDGISHAFGPDDTVPEWAEKAITNPDVWAEAPESDELPEGDIDDKWTVKQLKAYAEAESIDLGDAKTKAEILAKLAK